MIIPKDSGAVYQIATTRPPDIVVTDVRITGSISGLELTRRLRSNPRASTVGIIVLTTVSRPHDADVALKAGADTFLDKPVSGSVLRAAIERLLPGSVRKMSQCLPQSAEASPADVLDHGGVSSHTPRSHPEQVCVLRRHRRLSRTLGPCSHRMLRRKQLGGNASDTCRVGSA